MDHKEFAENHGYSLHMYSADRTVFFYTKNVEGHTIHLSINADEKKCKLEGYIGYMTVSTGDLQFPHPRFEDFFEDKLLNVLYAHAEIFGK
jgi:hypothetical protein